MRGVVSVRPGPRALVALCLGLSALPAAAEGHPPAPVDEGGRAIRGQLHTWLHQANVPLVRGRVQIRRTGCPGRPELVGCVFSARPRVMYLRPSGVRAPRLVFYHELGHVFDIRVLNSRERRRFKRIMGIRRGGWYGGALPPSEWFADAYAACADSLARWRGANATWYGYRPSRAQHLRTCALIRRAATPRGRPPQRPPDPPPVIEVEHPPPAQTQPSEGREPGDGEGGNDGPGGGTPVEPSGCTLVDQLLTGCEPEPAPAPGPL